MVAIGAVVLIFLAAVARFYTPGFGFTALLGLPFGDDKVPALRAVPHYQYSPAQSYDGQFYVQLALDPLLRDPATDRAMDLAPFRARRILFSWTAFAAGLGRPSWIVEAFALQNVVCWLILAIVLARWIDPLTTRGLLLWSACLLSHGLLWSVRFSLLDGPSLLLIAVAVRLVERGRSWWAALLVGVSGLGRETNLLAAAAVPRLALRDWRRLPLQAILVVLPVLIWYDYLRSIYRSTLLAGTNGELVVPFVGLLSAWSVNLAVLVQSGFHDNRGSVLLLASVAIQAAYLALRPDIRSPWWRVAAMYVLLMVVLDPVLAEPRTGAITRVLLPMTIGFNLLLARERDGHRFWPWFVAGNLHLVPALGVLPLLRW